MFKQILAKKVLVAGVAALVLGVGTTVFALQPEPQKEKEIVTTTSAVQQEEPKEEVLATETVVETPVTQPQPENTDPEPEPIPVVNPFQEGSPEWYVFNRRSELGKPLPLPTNSKNAKQYCAELTSRGYVFSSTPQLHGIGCWKTQGADRGHMSVVEQINPDGSVWISEMNSRGQVSITDSTPAGGWGKIDYKLILPSSTSYQYAN